jgi:hypothetical protein
MQTRLQFAHGFQGTLRAPSGNRGPLLETVCLDLMAIGL